MKLKPQAFVYFFISMLAFMALACNSPQNVSKVDYKNLQMVCQHRLTDVIVYDIFNPPVASRIYAYCNLAYYEALRHKTQAASITNRMKGFLPMPKPNKNNTYDFNLSAVKAFFKVAKALTFSKDSLKQTELALLAQFKNNLTENIYNQSISFGDTLAATILKRCSTDNYKLTRGMAKYTITSQTGIWQPTPPDYFDAVEPHWNIIKPFLLDSAGQFAPPPPPPYSLHTQSIYYKQLMETYNVVKNSNPTQDSIARYWDDNAFVTQHDGHLTYASKKTTPPGHWMGIIAILSQQQKASEITTAKVFALAAAAMFDGFITCWTEKFKSKTIRPITVIQENIDKNWNPILQTPPFPEYISGHSVISSAAATILSGYWGQATPFTDTTEMQYLGLKRSFTSIDNAAKQVGESRIYGGIHFRAAINEGRKQGQNIGKLYLQKLP
jgi:hypothetical protein